MCVKRFIYVAIRHLTTIARAYRVRAMKLTNYRLSDEHRQRLELHRQAFGLRSEAEALRDLIERYACEPVKSDPRPPLGHLA